MMNTLSISKDHLVPVGTIKTVDSDNYGTYRMRCIANVAWYDRSVDGETISKYHPKHWAGSYHIVSDNTALDSAYSSIFVALDEDNKDWYRNNRDCEYVKETGRRVKKLPVTSRVKDVKKFLEKYKPCLITETL